MKRLQKKSLCLWLVATLISILLIGIGSSAQAQQWQTANQVTVSWDPVTVASGTVSYRTYSKPEVGGVETVMGLVTATQATITFTAEGRYFLGVKAIRTVNSIEIESSRIAWSNVAADCQGGVTFGVQYYQPPGNVGGIRIKVGP